MADIFDELADYAIKMSSENSPDIARKLISRKIHHQFEILYTETETLLEMMDAKSIRINNG